MSDKKKRHVHHGKSSRDILSADRVLTAVGLKSGDTFLDAGCGDGFISLAASPIVGEKGKVYAVDIYPESIAAVKKEIQERDINNVEAIVADLTVKTPLNDDSIDLCIMANVLHGFVENQEAEEVMKEISRVIRPEGVFAVVEFKKIEKLQGPPFHERLAPQDVEDILVKHGFEAVLTSEVGHYHYLVKAVNKK
ncbi:MAG TPA: class I SAM-dependent methyltransferase [Methanobacterium sp.]